MKNNFLILLYIFCSIKVSSANNDTILVATRPIYSIVKNIDCGLDVKLLINKNISPHDYSLKPTDLSKLNKAKYIILTSKNLEGSLFNLIKKQEALYKKTILLDKIPGLKLIEYPDSHNNNAGHSHSSHHNHFHSGIDPHIWLNIDNVTKIVKHLSSFFAKHDLNKNVCFKKKSDTYIQKLSKLRNTADLVLSNHKNKHIIVSHDAYRYLLEDHNIKTSGVIISNSNKVMNIRNMLNLQEKIKLNNITCVFIEPQFNPEIVNRLFSGNKLKTALVDVEWGANDADEKIYISTMIKNLHSIDTCLK